MDFDIFNKDIRTSLESKKAIGIKIGLLALLLVIFSIPIYVLSEKVGIFILSIGLLSGFIGIFIHFIMSFISK